MQLPWHNSRAARSLSVGILSDPRSRPPPGRLGIYGRGVRASDEWLSAEALACLSHSLGARGTVSDLRRLRGGLEADTFFFELDSRHFVFKRFIGEAARASVEFENLVIVASGGVPTARPVALDAEGQWFGSPAFVMTALPGRPNLHPIDPERWAAACAVALASIHRIDPARARTVVPPRWERRKPPSVAGLPWEHEVVRALDELYAVVGDQPVVFSHDDPNPGNVLFAGEELVGIVDWTDVTLEPREAAVGLFGHFLAVMGYAEAAPAFLEAYRSASGATLVRQPLWDVLYGLRGIGRIDHWVRAFADLGLALTAEQIRARSIEWIERALTHL